MERPSGAHYPLHHSPDQRLSLGTLYLAEKSVVRLGEVARKVFKGFSNSCIRVAVAESVDLELDP